MIIIDFIDMLSRVDKLTMMEELELAMEADKAKPQVGQLSDLGLVEMTRHRQGQALSEIFAKRCPHCQGNGYIMEDLKFASATSEGEYRAKAAKIKLPMGGKKKFNNKFNNKPEKEEIKEQQPMIQEEKLEITENPSVVAQEEVKELKEEKTKAAKTRGRSRKLKKSDVAAENLAQTVISEGAEIAPIIAEDADLNKVDEVKPESPDVKPEAESNQEEAKTKTTKRSRRPNRNSQKRTRKTANKDAEE